MSCTRNKPSPVKAFEGFIKSQKEMPHFTLVSVLIGVGVSVAAILTLSALDGSLWGLFGGEAEAKYQGSRVRNRLK